MTQTLTVTYFDGRHPLGAPATLAARGEFSGTNELKVNDIPNPGAIVGYRLMAFYP